MKNNTYVNEFQSELLRDEQMLWTGQPDPNIIFTGSDIFLVPFSLLWGGFAIFWEFMASTGVANAQAKQAQGPVWVFPLFGIPFVVIGLYFIFGRFIYKAWRKRRTYYAVTNKRVIVLTKGIGRDIQAAFINTLPAVNKSIRSNGKGTVRFGNSSPMVSMYGNTGMNFFGSFYSRTKIWSEQMLQRHATSSQRGGILLLRLRMPFDGFPNERSLIMKIRNYPAVLDVPNSITHLPDFLQAASVLIERRRTGIFNVVNPGVISPYRIMELYREIVDPTHRCQRLAVEHLKTVAKTARSNCMLSTAKIEGEGIRLQPIEHAVRAALSTMRSATIAASVS